MNAPCTFNVINCKYYNNRSRMKLSRKVKPTWKVETHAIGNTFYYRSRLHSITIHVDCNQIYHFAVVKLRGDVPIEITSVFFYK